MNAIWNRNIGNNIRIMLLNNGGGEIFNTLPDWKCRGARISSHCRTPTSAKGWAEERGFLYLRAEDETQLGKP